jgi:thiamine biosynthesis lipoprotein
MSVSAAGAVRLSHDEEVMGTVVSFRILSYRCGDGALLAAIGEVCAFLHSVDDTFSTWKPSSPLSRLRRNEVGIGDVPEEIPSVLALCEEARVLSGGWFDPWAMPGGVDPTGLVKGWAIERAVGLLSAAGVEAAILNGGGDIAAIGSPEGSSYWPVGIQHPWRPEALACVIAVEAAVATSGSYERGLHLVDPRSGRLSREVASATVTGPSLAVCDSLATALAVGGDPIWERIVDLDGYEAYMIRPDGSEVASDGIVFAR